MQESRRKDLVALFESHGALADPGLLDVLAADAEGPVRAQAVLAGLEEVPFHFDAALWQRLEERLQEQVSAPPPPPPPTMTQRARKQAMEKAALQVYAGQTKPAKGEDEGADPDAADDDGPVEGPPPAKTGPPQRSPFVVKPRSDWRPLAADHRAELEVVEDMTGNSTCEGTTDDFAQYFRDRFRRLQKILRQRRELRSASTVERVRPSQQEVQLIGMVVESYQAKSGNRVLELEDETGTIRCLVKQDERQLMAMAEGLVTDEVVGVVGQASPKGDMLFLEQLLRPDIPRPDPNRKVGADVPLMAAFLSDVHVGNRTFLEENWQAMLKWLAGHGTSRREREAAGRVKYLLIPGDLVDGVGVYPGQQDELTIDDIFDQYAEFGRFMEAIPDHVELVIQPGNHDTAARPAEPQPGFSKEVQGAFSHHATRFFANPATFSLHGVKVLGYHGSSLIDFATTVADLEVNRPLDTMERMLQSRHLSPIYGKITPVAPEHTDYMVVDTVPDVFVTGHVHVPGIRNYRGVQMVNCGTWQGQTSYQKMLNFTPDPARMPLIDLQSLRGTLVDFQTPERVGQLMAA